MRYNKERFEQIGYFALRKLRQEKLSNGHPFMINSPELPFGQCYFEYPNGSFQVVTICRIENDFKVVRDVSKKEQKALKKLLVSIS